MFVQRITYIASAVAVAALVVTGCSAPNSGSAPQTAAKSGATIPAKPSAPVSLHILDVAGNQKLTRTMIDDFVKAHSDVCLLYTSPSPRDGLLSRMPSSA